ncbi:MAG TPA: magnesium transporter CorA family protein [Bacteroidales bacterium]|jgi:magnesium transporter|nr:magnesium transporter CorA family protein [Bacteroidales bacterium]HOS58434.1 magnesium transporter CorA family protein [Bacteroidales bacterium]HPY81233.1 magnesium transporter CorA family protein [Bacteroidales bacterium]HQA86141.1 magnesium transporter CorA family protein [Bacteroidales bacterium]HRR04449.1 magnesium transporter CorA family protein [Bacteroidales bacterium]
MVDTISFGVLKWHHITNPTVDDLDYLRENFHFHPLDIEDCSSFVQRPKIDVYDDYFFLVLHFPLMDKRTNMIKTEETKIFWGKDFLITVGNSHYVVQDLFNLTKLNPQEFENEKLSGTSDAILYHVLYRMMKETFLLIERLGNEIDLISRDLFSRKTEKIIKQISLFRKNIIHVNTIFRPQLRLFHKFESGEVKGFAEDMEDYWGNILDFYQKMWDMIEDYGELVIGLNRTFDSLQANKTNEIMRVLTIISTIVLPLTFITGLYGMNVYLPMAEHPAAFWMLLGACFLIVFALLFLFRHKRWM